MNETKHTSHAMLVEEIAMIRAVNRQLLAACEQVLPALKGMPPPELGDWNWPQLADIVRAAIARAEGGAA